MKRGDSLIVEIIAVASAIPLLGDFAHLDGRDAVRYASTVRVC